MRTSLVIYLTIMWIHKYNTVESHTESQKEPLVPDRIVKDDEFQYIVIILIEDVIEFPLCIGTIIGRVSVLTAAHCLGTNWKLIYRNLRIIAGNRYLLPTDSLHMVSRRVVKHITHPKFNTKSFAYDIAVLTTETPFQFDNNPRISQVPLRSRPIENGRLCEFLGWGIDANFRSNASNIPLIATTVRVYAFDGCEFIFRKVEFEQYQICGQKSNFYQTTCAFDIGTPLICDNTLVGIGTKRFKCDDLRKPHIFVSISNLDKLSFYSEDETITFNDGTTSCNLLYVFIVFCKLLIFVVEECFHSYLLRSIMF